jgi:putative membrane protein insertion efficiency factor
MASGPLPVLGSSIIGIVRMYQWLARRLPVRACRFEPTCSQYMIEAIEKYGVPKGVRKGIGRILRCHPGHPGGIDRP